MSAKRILHAGMRALTVLLLALATALVVGLAPAFAEDGALQVGEEAPIEYAAQPVDDEALVHAVLDAAQALAPEAETPFELLQAVVGAMRADSSIAPDTYARVMAGVIEHLGYECLTVEAVDGSRTWNMVKVDDAWYHVDAERELVLVSDEAVRAGDDGVAEWRVADEALEMELPPAPEDWQEKEAAAEPTSEVESPVEAPADEELITGEEEPIQFEAPSASGFVWPMKKGTWTRISQGYTYNKSTKTGHGGIDISAPKGTEIIAAMDGVVTRVLSSSDTAETKTWGNFILIWHSNGMSTLYSHLDSYAVKVGDSVKQGQVIGYCGKTGRASGYHLHFEMRVDGTKNSRAVTPQLRVNPSNYVNEGNLWDGNSGNNDIPVTPNSNSVNDVPARWYRIRLKLDPDQGLDISGASKDNGANLQVWRWGGYAQQSFSIDPVAAGGYRAYTIHPVHAEGKFLTVENNSLDSGVNVFQWENNGSNSQKWYIERNNDGTYSFRNSRSGKYLDVYSSGTSNGNNVWQHNGNGTDAQKFYLITDNPTLWTFKLSNSSNSYEYTGKAIDPGLRAFATPMCPNYEIMKWRDYEVSYSNNVNVGTASWKVLSFTTGSNNTATGTFKITPAPISKAFVSSVDTQSFTGSALTPKPTLTFNGLTLKEGTDYTLSYSNNVNIGTATITINGKGNFSGSSSTTFMIKSAEVARIPSGTYIIQSKRGNRCIDIEGASNKAGANARLMMPSGTASQMFTIGWDASLSANTIIYRKTLSLSPASDFIDTNAQTATLVNGKGHGWTFEDAGDGYYYIYYKRSSGDIPLFLNTLFGTGDEGRNVGVSVAPGKPGGGGSSLEDEFKWKLIPVSGKAKETGIRGTYFLQSKVGNRVLDVSGGGSANRTNVQIWNPHFSTSHPEGEIFSINWNPSLSASNIMLVSAGKYIDHAGGKSEPNNVWLWEGNGGWNQNWFFENAGGGYYYVRDMLGYYLEVEGGVDANGTNVRAALFTGANAQKWKLLDLDISRATVTGVSDKTYTGKAQTQSPVVKLNGITLQEGTDYTLSYKNNTKVGTATITVTGKGNYTGTATKTFKIVAAPTPTPAPAEEIVPVYRLYNKKTSEHLYTINYGEFRDLPEITKGDWAQEGIAWYAPKKSNTPVYRLYNKKSGDHHYTTDRGEADALCASFGWTLETTAFYSDDAKRVPLYRLYNGRLQRGQHHYTADANERDALTTRFGWKDEAIGFYGVKR